MFVAHSVTKLCEVTCTPVSQFPTRPVFPYRLTYTSMSERILNIFLSIPDNREFRVLLPFGVPLGDVLIPSSLSATSGPQSKLAISNITCPFFGTSESIIYVSVPVWIQILVQVHNNHVFIKI